MFATYPLGDQHTLYGLIVSFSEISSFMASSFYDYVLLRHVLLPERIASVACGGNHTGVLTQSGDNQILLPTFI